MRALARPNLSLEQPTGDPSELSLGSEQPSLVRMPDECGPELQGYMRLSGTVYNPKRPERSLAILSLGTKSRAAVYRGGANISGVHLLEIEPRGVLISVDKGDVCWLRMTRANPPARPTPPARPQPKPRRARKTVFSKDDLARGIREIRPGVYSVDRTLLERAIAQAPALARTTRGKVIQQHGTAYGLSLSRIASKGLLSHLGFKRGDVLKTINGISVASVDGMLNARTQLASAPKLSVALMRRGQPTTLEYQVNQ